jgi:hypothetical protein
MDVLGFLGFDAVALDPVSFVGPVGSHFWHSSATVFAISGALLLLHVLLIYRQLARTGSKCRMLLLCGELRCVNSVAKFCTWLPLQCFPWWPLVAICCLAVAAAAVAAAIYSNRPRTLYLVDFVAQRPADR